MTKSKSDDPRSPLYCSFCGKSQHEVRKLIAGPSVFICDECVDLCTDIIKEENDGIISTETLGMAFEPEQKYENMGLKEAREKIEKELITKALARNRGNLSKTSTDLGISRPTLYDMMAKLGLLKE